MFRFFLSCCVAFILAGAYKGQPTEKECCLSKSVGDVEYVLIEKGDVPEVCTSGCIYQMVDKPGSRYCFAPGQLPVNCTGTK